MPTYEYACKKCGEHLEVVQSFSDDPLTVCGNCGGELKKVFGNIGIVFKGSGFYKTDSRGKATVKSSSSDGSGDAASDKKASDTKSEPSKPAADTKQTPAPSSSNGTSTSKAAAAS
jgi:putative FmdB family regulatory protein